MRLGVFGILAAATVAHAKLGVKTKERVLEPEDVGRMHTEAFDKLGELVNERGGLTDIELMHEVSKISAAYCPKGDGLCQANAYKASLDEFENSKNGKRLINYPGHFDAEVRAHMNRMHRTIKGFKGDNFEEVMETLHEIQTDLQDMKDVDFASQATGLATISVAMESTELWKNAYTEKQHPLHRHLANGSKNHDAPWESVKWEDVILADVNATLAQSISLVQQVGTNNPFTVIALPPILFISVVQFAIPASVLAAFPNGTRTGV